MFKKISLKDEFLEDVETAPSIQLINEHVFKIGLAHLIALKKTYKTSPEQVSVLGDALIEKINNPILDDFQAHPLKNFFYLAFINLSSLCDVTARTPDIHLTETENDQFSRLINRKLFFCMDSQERSLQQLLIPRQTLLIKKMIKYMGFQTQVMAILKPFFKPTDPFITALFSAPLSILNQKKLLLADNSMLVNRGLMSFTHQLKTSNQNSEFIDSDWFLNFLEHHFDCPDIYEKHVRDFIFEENIILKGLTKEDLENDIIPKAIEAYKQHPYGQDVLIDYKEHTIVIPKENIPKFEYIKKINIYASVYRLNKLLNLLQEPICGISYQHIISALLDPEITFKKTPNFYENLTIDTKNWLEKSPIDNKEKLHALEQLTAYLIYHKLGKQPVDYDCYDTKNHFASLSRPILNKISQHSTNINVRNLIDMILEQYETIEEPITEPTKDRQQFYSLILAFSICNKDKGLFYFCANKMRDAIKTKIDIIDINQIIIKRLFDYYEEHDINYFKNYISLLVLEMCQVFDELKQSKYKIEQIPENSFKINRIQESEEIFKLAINYLIKIESTDSKTYTTSTESETEAPKSSKANAKLMNENSDGETTIASTESESESTQTSYTAPIDLSKMKKAKKKRPQKTDLFERLESQLPMELDLDTVTDDETLRFIQARVTSFPKCKNLPLLLCESTDLTDNEKWEMLYTKCNIKYSYIPIDTTTIVHGTKYEVIFNLKLITEKLNSSSPLFSYNNYTIYELKQGADYRLFLAKDKTGTITLVHNCEGSKIDHIKHEYKETIKGILDSPNPPQALFLA